MHTFHNPVRTVAGLGALAALPELLGTRRALLLTFGEAASLGLVELVRLRLGDRLVAVIDCVAPNPDLADLELLYPLVWQQEAEVVIALGGGSVIDSAKAVLVGTPSGQFHELRQWLREGQRFDPPRCKALIAIPTTAGTGSEVTPWATVWDRELQRKHSLHLPQTWPEAAVIDPVLMRSLPEAVTLQSGLDALSHALEAIWNRNANPVSDALALAAARGILVTLPALKRAPDNMALREAMAVAALQAGLAFSNTRTALAHSLSYPMTLRFGLPHGIACSFTLPMVARLAIGRDAERDAVLAQALGPLADAPARLESFLHDLGVKTRFADYGVDDAGAAALLDAALQGDRGRNFIGGGGMSAYREEKLRLRGDCVAGASGSFDVFNPFTGAAVGSAAKASREQVEQALLYARDHRSSLSRFDRASILRRAAELLAARADEAARLITAEAGLSLQDSRYEVGRVLDVLGFGATEALRDDGQVFACDLTAHGRKRKVISMREPLLGVIAAITPFNHPMNQVAHKVVPSIASNNRLVLKPSEKVPLSALWFADLLYEAGLPPAMFQVLTGDPAEIAATLITHPAVELVTFTGGVEIGKRIAHQAGYRRTVLELGGNDPLIVCEDAELERAALLAAQGSYRNSGQRCTAVKRILVQASVAERFTDLLVAATESWPHGDPLDERNAMGTVIDEAAARLLERRAQAAVAAGARLRCGLRREGALLAPTVLDRVRPEMELVYEESFGPISPVMTFETVDEAIALVNASRFGLSSGVCTNRMDWATRFAQELQVGTVNVWEVPGYRTELTPFGGIKDSGLGHKEGVQEAVKAYTHLKTFTLPW